MLLNFIVWNVNPEILPIGPLVITLVWTVFAASFFFRIHYFSTILQKGKTSLRINRQNFDLYGCWHYCWCTSGPCAFL